MAGKSTVGAIQGGRVAVAVTLDDSQFVLGTAKVRANLRKLSAGLNTFANSVIRTGMAMGVPLAAALRQFTEFDHQMRVVNAVTQASGAEFAALTNRARELGKTTSWTAREVAEGMTSLGRMGWKPKEIDESIGAMMDLARATDADIGIVSTLASNTMRAFKASTREATHYADVLTVAANKSSQTVVDIGEAMTIVGPLAQQAGQSFEDTAAALMVMANNGVRGSIAGTALRNAIVKLNDSARQETLAKYNVQVRDAYGNMRRLANIIGDLFHNTRNLGTGELTSLSAEIFGLRGMLGGAVLTNNINEAADALDAVMNSAGEANRVARGIEEGLWGAVKIAVSAFQDLGLAIGDALKPTLEAKLGRITSLVRTMGTWVKNNKEQIKQTAAWILKAVKAAIELKLVLKFAGAIKGVLTFANAFKTLAANISAATAAGKMFPAFSAMAGAKGLVGGAATAGAARAGALASASTTYASTLAATIGGLAGLTAEIALVVVALQQFRKYLGLKAELAAQELKTAEAEEDARTRTRKTLEKIDNSTSPQVVREQVEWMRNGLGEIVSYVHQQNQGELTDAGKAYMMKRAGVIGEEFGLTAEQLVGKVVQAVANNNYDELNDLMKSSTAWIVGLAKERIEQGITLATNEFGSGSEELRVAQRRRARFSDLDRIRVASVNSADRFHDTGAMSLDASIAFPNNEDLSALETSLAESVMSPYQKSIAELVKRQQEYADLIADKIAELQRMADTGAMTEAGRKAYLDEIARLKNEKAQFDQKIAGQQTDLTRAENAARIDRVSGAVVEAIRQQAEMGPMGQKAAEKMRDEWVGRFTTKFRQLYVALQQEQQAAVSARSEGGKKVSENEQKRIDMISELFTQTAAKISELRNLDLGEEVSQTVETAGSFKASEVFGQIVDTGKFEEETAKNTKAQEKNGREQITIMREQKRLLETISQNNALLYG